VVVAVMMAVVVAMTDRHEDREAGAEADGNEQAGDYLFHHFSP
jgi:hypothetical protein